MNDGAAYAVRICQEFSRALLRTATQGDYIALSMGAGTPISAHFAPWIRLVSPTGVLLGNSATGQGASDIAVTALTSATYRPIVRSYTSLPVVASETELLTLSTRSAARDA